MSFTTIPIMHRFALLVLLLYLPPTFADDIRCVPNTNPFAATIYSDTPHYTGNREPLEPSPFYKLPVGAVKAEGWIGKFLELQRDGLTGHLGEISRWLEKEDNAWLKQGGKHGWEEVPYWLKGYGNLAYLLEDEKMTAETKVWLDAIFQSQREDGFFGPGNPDGEKGMDLWPNMLVLFMMQSYYEYSGDQKAIDFMTKYFRWVQTYPDKKFLKTYWENSRGGDMLFSCLWLYNQTGDKFLLDVAEKIHRNTANWMQQSSLPNWHNVNIAQCFREPATWWMLSKQDWHKEATYNNFWLIRAAFGQVPGGMFGSDENCRLGYFDPRQGVETCGMVEQMSSDMFLVRITGDPSWADNCEDVAFNTYPTAFMPDFKALRYITSPNQVTGDSKNHSPGIQNSGPFMMMNPFSSRCCQHNHSHGWPYYAEHLWLATPDRGLAAVLYNACNVKAKVGIGQDAAEVSIHEETVYPFEEQVKFTVTTPKEVEFPLYLRVPKWCSDMQIAVNGKPVKFTEEGDKPMPIPMPQSYVRINRMWQSGDTVSVTMPMQLSHRVWQQSKNSVSIDYGPLTFSLNIKERYVQKSSRETALHDSGWQEGADESKYPSFEIYPDSPWNYAIASESLKNLDDVKLIRKDFPSDNYPWTQSSVPLSIKLRGKKIASWTLDQYGLCAPVPMSPVRTNEPVEEIELVPMGAARLRISAFPVAE